MLEKLKKALLPTPPIQKQILVVRIGQMRPEELSALAEKLRETHVVIEAQDPKAFTVLQAPVQEEGDGNAEFLGEGTQEELDRMNKEDEGFKPGGLFPV